MYLDDLAQRIRQGVLQTTAVPGDSDGLFLSYAVLARAKGLETSLSDVHDAWVAWQSRIDSSHPALIPFNELAEAVRREDEPFLAAIHAAARGQAQPADASA